MGLLKLHNVFFVRVFYLALAGIVIGMTLHVICHVPAALARSCFSEEALRIKIKTINSSDEKVMFPTCAVAAGIQAEWVGEGRIEDYRTAETTREAFRLIYRIEASQSRKEPRYLLPLRLF